MNSEPTLASVPRRIAAYGIDVGIAFVALLAFQALLYPVNPLLRGTAVSGNTLHGWVTLTVTIPTLIFFGLSWASPSGATPGMRLMHLRVRSAEGERVPYSCALLRGVVLLASFEVNHVVLFYPQPIWDAPSPGFRSGFLAVYALVLIYLGVTLLTPRRQGPHDLAAGTIVIRSRGTA
jgi:uncharacterized RDD family membrane protein YckC